MRSMPTVPIVPPTPAPMHHFSGKICNLPWPLEVRTLFSNTYLRIETLPAFETFAVDNMPNCAGGMRMRCGITAQALAAHTLTISALISPRISSGVFCAHNEEPDAPFGALVTLVIRLWLTRPP